MKQFSNFDTIRQTADHDGVTQLPPGAYICRILATRYIAPVDGKSGQVAIQFDISEGSFSNFFRNLYDNNTQPDRKWKGKTVVWEPRDDGTNKDEWTKRTLARWVSALEDSNSGYKWDWDETKWAGKLVGIIFGRVGTVIDGTQVEYTEASRPTSVNKVRSGDYKIPDFKAKNGYSAVIAAADDDPATVPIPEAEDIPFL